MENLAFLAPNINVILLIWNSSWGLVTDPVQCALYDPSRFGLSLLSLRIMNNSNHVIRAAPASPITKPPLLQRSRLTGGGSPNLVGLVERKAL